MAWVFFGFMAALPACVAILGDFSVQQGVPGDAGPTNGADASDAALADGPADVEDAGCAPGETSCGAGCVDLLKTAANCGACGHDCNGGACTAGVCGPYVIAMQPTTGTVAKVATDGTRVVWADTGTATVSQIPAKGGATITLAGSSAANGAVGSELALAKSTVAFNYVGGSNPPSVGLATVDLPNSGAPTYTGVLVISGVSLDPSATHLAYLNTHGTLTDLNDCVISGRTGGVCAGLGSGRFLGQTAADNTFMFFDLTGANITPAQAGLYLDPVNTNTPNIFTTEVASSLAVDGTWAYWTIQGDAGGAYAIHRTLEATPGAEQTVVLATKSPAFAIDGANVYYWTGSAVVSRPVAGGTETTRAPATAFAQIAVGGGLLVWTDGATISGLVLP